MTSHTFGTRHSLQTVMARTGSMPLAVASDLLQRFAPHPCNVVLDPFCGKGTSLLAARILGVPAYGLDVAPEAVAAARAKLTSVRIADLQEYLYLTAGEPDPDPDVPEEVKIFFSPATLSQILSLRSRLLTDLRSNRAKTRQLATFSLGLLLGILHGHASYSLSIPSAHAFSMSPRYVHKYANAHQLERPDRDVRECLLSKATLTLADPLPVAVPHLVKLGSAAELLRAYQHLTGRVSVILTSPPYLDAQTYAKDNWLRLWLLGYDYKAIRSQSIETSSISRYGAFLAPVLRQCYELLSPQGVLICVAGDVRRRRKKLPNGRAETFATGNFIRQLIQSQVPGFALDASMEQSVKTESRYFHALSKSNGHGRRTRIERIVLARKP